MHDSARSVRNLILTLLLGLTVIFGGTHANAFSPHHEDSHVGSPLSSAHDGDEESGQQGSSANSQINEAAHGHVAMGEAPDTRGMDNRLSKATSVLPIREATALPSLGIAPLVEPPSA